MTVKELKELIEKVPDDYVVCYEYDGPDTLKDLPANCLYISETRQNIVLINGSEGER